MPGDRIFNFSAGPAVLPEPVIEQARHGLAALPGVGMSVLEVSHRSAPVDEILESAASDVRAAAGLPSHFHVLFLQGGATQQFAMAPLNLLPPDGSADYVLTGVWARKAHQEARRLGNARAAGSTEDDRFARVPAVDELDLDGAAAYLHVTSNNTVVGTQWRALPADAPAPLVVDASSDFFSRPMAFDGVGLVYAGAQKNLGPAGVTLVIVRDDLVRRAPARGGVPTTLQYRTHVDGGSRHNTPPVFAIYVVGLVVKWILASGGLDEMARRSERRARKLYQAIDRTAFYRGAADPDSRSRMNVTFRLPTEALEARFVGEARDAGLVGLEGHRSVGGVRASIYNACPEAAVDALTAFMAEFERTRG